MKGVILGFMFDTTVFNDIKRRRMDIDKLPKNLNCSVTHIQFDQLNKTPDPNLRDKLLHIFKCIVPEEIPTESAVVGVSKVGRAKVGDGTLLEELRKGNLKHTEDALIAEAAITNDLILVTDDKVLRKKVKRLGGRAAALEQFLRQVAGASATRPVERKSEHKAVRDGETDEHA